MSPRPADLDEGRRLALGLLRDAKNDVISMVPALQAPPADFFKLHGQTRKRYFSEYLDALRAAVETGDSTDFLGNETFQGYTSARNGSLLRDVLSIPASVRSASHSVLSEMVASGAASGRAAYNADIILSARLDESAMIRAQAFIQTRDETIAFYHENQVEIDRFPSSLASTLDFDTLMGSAMKKCVELVGVVRVAFFTRDLVTNELRLVAANFEQETVFGGDVVKLDDHLVEVLVKEVRPLVVTGQRRSSPLLAAIMKRMKSKAVLLVPLMVRDRNVGAMLADNVDSPQVLTPEMADLALRFCNRVAGAMENARLHGSEQRKLRETMALLEVSRLVSSTLDIDVLLPGLARIAVDVCGVLKCSIFIYFEDEDRFFPAATHSKIPSSDWELELVPGVGVEDLDASDIEALMDGHQVVLDEPGLSPFMPDETVPGAQVSSIVLVPFYSRERFLGIIVLFHPKEGDELEPEDLNLITAIAGQAAMALENVTLYEDLEVSYFSTVRALARAIEVKDPYTYGHSERVTEYALAIARMMGLPDYEVKNIKYAAALHDIGKIGIAPRILDKPGSLSDEEFVHIKTHPQLGDSIIEPVAFLKAPRKIILHHHERYDGSGYPDGLKAEEIELGARILAVADAFEAMMSDRPYRKALALEEALREIGVNSGGQFDPLVVEALLDALQQGEIPSVGHGYTA